MLLDLVLYQVHFGAEILWITALVAKVVPRRVPEVLLARRGRLVMPVAPAAVVGVAERAVEVLAERRL